MNSNPCISLFPFSAEWVPAVNVAVGSHVVHSVPPPGSGSILVYILNILKHFDINGPEDDKPVLYHRSVNCKIDRYVNNETCTYTGKRLM